MSLFPCSPSWDERSFSIVILIPARTLFFTSARNVSFLPRFRLVSAPAWSTTIPFFFSPLGRPQVLAPTEKAPFCQGLAAIFFSWVRSVLVCLLFDRVIFFFVELVEACNSRFSFSTCRDFVGKPRPLPLWGSSSVFLQLLSGGESIATLPFDHDPSQCFIDSLFPSDPFFPFLPTGMDGLSSFKI